MLDRASERMRPPYACAWGFASCRTWRAPETTSFGKNEYNTSPVKAQIIDIQHAHCKGQRSAITLCNV